MDGDGAGQAEGDLAHERHDQDDRCGQHRSGPSGAADEEGGDGRQEGDHGEDTGKQSVERQHVVMATEKASGQGDLTEYQNRENSGGDAQGEQRWAQRHTGDPTRRQSGLQP